MGGKFPRNLDLCILLDRGGEKKALLELRQAFDLAAAKTSGLANHVFSIQTGFSSVSIH